MICSQMKKRPILKQSQSIWKLLAPVVFFLAGAALLGTWQHAEACGGGLVANIGYSTNGPNGPWLTNPTMTLDLGDYLFTQALDANNNAITTHVDTDYVNGQTVEDYAYYSWDFCYPTGYETQDALNVTKSYSSPGDRTVKLFVHDRDGSGYTDDADPTDSLFVKVPLTVETDWMSGYGLVNMDLFPGRWSNAGFSSVLIDADHESNCEYHEYLYDAFQTDAELVAWLDNYENQSCALYLIGINKWSTDPAKQSITGVCVDHKYSCILRGKGAGLSEELHEPACHDTTIGAINHCTSGNPCACNSSPNADTFCATCQQKLKDYIQQCGP